MSDGFPRPKLAPPKERNIGQTLQDREGWAFLKPMKKTALKFRGPGYKIRSSAALKEAMGCRISRAEWKAIEAGRML